MPRNYKRDRGGRFAKVNSIGKGKKLKGSARALPSTPSRKAPIQQPAKGNVLVAVDNKGNARQVSAAQARHIQADNRRIRTGAILGAVAGGIAGAYAGPIGVPVGSLLGSQAGASIANERNKARRRKR